jgi:tetratricopeptide (TPR) repeat protein
LSDYYQILQLSPTADQAQIRAAYKRLAMQYHPDRNMGDKRAEEMFKFINEAYHVLSDPLKKARYDGRFYQQADYPTAGHRHRDQRFRRNRQPQPERPYYKVDKNYFKIQGLAILSFLVLASICYSIGYTVQYLIQRQQMKKFVANTKLLTQVNGLFDSGKITEAFDLVSSLRTQDPKEFRFITAKDSLVNVLAKMADEKYQQGDYKSAIEQLLVLKNYETSTRETLQKIANCQYYLGNYEESLRALKQLHNQQPENLELIYQIAMINLEKTKNPQEALMYFNLGKKLFKQNLTDIYGQAFELVMDPDDAPDIYFEIFLGRARTNIELSDPREAVTDCNWSVYLRRERPEGYYLRSLARIQSQDRSGLCSDIVTAKRLGLTEAGTLEKKYCR